MAKRPLVVLFDANPIVGGNLSGVGYYAKGAISALAEAYPVEIQLVGHCFNFRGKKDVRQLPQAANIRYVESRLLPGKALALLRRFGLQFPFRLLIKAKGDIAFFPNYVSLPTGRIPSVISVHDLSFVDFPQFLQPANRSFLERFVPRSLKAAAHVFAISVATKQGIIEHYDLPENKITVTHIPVAAMPHNVPPSKLVTGSYILFMSTLEPRKNFMTLVHAYCALPQTLKAEYSLVLAGSEGWAVSEAMREIKQLQSEGEHIIVTGYVDDTTRAALYEHASLFVMPSFNEGFGMPLLEAMSYGIPIVTSDIPVFREVAQDAALFAIIDNHADFADKMQLVLTKPDQRNKLINAGTQRLQAFSWHTVATQMYDVFIKVSGSD
jgi:glycosyltransferase involved in cell wall biosynthesis